MHESWTDFEKYVFNKLSDIERDIALLKGRAAAWGAAAAILVTLAGNGIIYILTRGK